MREEKMLPILPFSYELSRGKIRTTLEEKASTVKLNGFQIWDIPGHHVALLDLGMKNVPKDAVGDSYKL